MTTYKTNPVKILDNGNALVTKAFAKQACIFGTPEYEMWKKVKVDHPDAQMVTKKIKKNPEKKTNRNMTYENMELFIKQQENADELLKEFERQKKMSKIKPSPYAAVLEWFEDMFEDSTDYQPLFAEMSAEKEKQKAENTDSAQIIERYVASAKEAEKSAA